MNRNELVNSAFSALNLNIPSDIPQRGIIYGVRTAICALTSKMYSGQGGVERAWSAIRTGTRARLDAAQKQGDAAYLAFGAEDAKFLLPWPVVSPLTGDNAKSGRDPIVVELTRHNSWCFVGPGGVRTNIDQYRLGASTAEAA